MSERQSSGCSACDQMGQTPTPEHLAGVARFEAQEQSCSVWAKGGGCTLPKRHDGLHVSPLEAENARLRERVGALEERAETAEGRVLALADALSEMLLLNHEKTHDGVPAQCGEGTCVIGRELVVAARDSVMDSLADDLAAALAGQEPAGGAG